ncbi:hypothetical protein QEH52_05560 [Coraliomargarita sp. SDUM461003]|uniref:Uncharacterized protein n=1 Tax=Thalassobacterium maritimum TaxID=3041265 RepID=A0ABU1AS34_9BACT|nr:hypothetical protein [Coraliomargarita sp. SDUM461003]MDQ8206966.1 hypothetical protein [Coraliomargarita sp. SDUM461003]
MFIINDAFQSGVIEACSTASSRRYYRGRNSASANADGWHFPPELPSDQPDVAEILEHSSRAGIKAVRQSLVPACFVWALMALIALAYYWLPAASHFFIGLERLQAFLGRLFPFLGMGLSVGVLAELVRILSAGKKSWARANTVNAGFNLLVFGVLGLLQGVFYQQQTLWFGEGQDFRTLASKVLVDQFGWTVFFANPYQTILFIWKENQFKFSRVWQSMRPFKSFWGMRVLPVLITNWAFWIPMVSIIYSFPSSLQLPLAILAVTIWVIILSFLTTEENTNDNHTD